MKKLLELLCCIVHPVAVVLIWATIWFRRDFAITEKIAWAVLSIVPFVPFVYVLTGHDFL